MKKRISVCVSLAVLVALALTACVSANTQTKHFFELVITGTPRDVQAAISNGADLKARNESGDTALILAAGYNKNPEVVATLLKAGADLEAKNDDGRTALIDAALGGGNPEVIMMLLNAGANVQAKDKMGQTAVYYARYNTNLKGTDALKKLEEASK